MADRRSDLVGAVTMQGLLPDVLRHSAKLRPRHLAVRDESRSLTYLDLLDRANRIAVALSEGLGVGLQERFAVLSENRMEFVEIVFAAALAGCVCVPLNYRLAPRELAEILEDARVSTVLAESRFGDALEAVRAAGFEGRVVWFDGAESSPDTYEWLLQSASPHAPARGETLPSDVVLQMYTSGTTGRPKGVMLSHRNLLACSWSHLVERTVISDERYLTTAPLCHLAAGSRMWLLVHAGATHIIHCGFEAERVADTMVTEGITSTFMVPAMLSRLLTVPAARGRRLADRVRLLNYGAARMSPELLTAALERLGCDFQEGYGLTEASPNLTILPPEDHRRNASGHFSPRLASVGRETVGVHVRVVDGEDRDVAVGEVGEVIAKGANIMEGYWRLPEQTAEALRGGWLRTGDLGKVDDDGYIYLVDRVKDMLISGGINVYPAEIERQLEQHPLVAEVAVVGRDDDRWGEVPVAFVVAERGAPPASEMVTELAAFITPRLARFKQPRRYELIEALPRNVAGKVIKRELRELAAQTSESSPLH
jgi:long-chain acyl-CoA synthetase